MRVKPAPITIHHDDKESGLWGQIFREIQSYEYRA